MKIQKSTSKKKIIIITAIIALVLIGTGIFAYTQSPIYLSNDENRSEVQKSTNNVPAQEKDNPTDENETGDDPERPNPTDNIDRAPSESTQQSNARIHIPNYQAAGGSVTVNISISEVWRDGQCVIRAEGPRTETARMDVFPAAQNSGCGPTISNLPPGHYTVTAWAERSGQRTNQKVLQVDL